MFFICILLGFSMTGFLLINLFILLFCLCRIFSLFFLLIFNGFMINLFRFTISNGSVWPFLFCW